MSKMNAFFCQGFDKAEEFACPIPAILCMHSHLLWIGFLLNQHGLKKVPL